ncbi:MAG: competence damage-inducible protein A [Rhodomicrobium sp.]|nr:MAG: competence damage-inducible protein A [Rhodomicrobium sp.]
MFDPEIMTAADELVTALKQRGRWVTCAESCTGGLLSGAITSVAGASSCFASGFVTYSNEAKHTLLGVSVDTLERYGAVSAETAREMASGALEAAEAMNSPHGLALSITGIAGPGGGSTDKPVGLVFIGAAMPGAVQAKRYEFGDAGRDIVRRETLLAALRFGLECLGK